MDTAKKLTCIRELFDSPKNIDRVRVAITQAVRRSFVRDQVTATILLPSVAAPTRDEISRRTNICYDWLIVMKGDMGYSTRKACALLDDALTATLENKQWEPPAADRAYAS